MKAFDCCSLTLQPTTNPVVTPQGWIFDKEAIITFILDKKKEYNKKLKNILDVYFIIGQQILYYMTYTFSASVKL